MLTPVHRALAGQALANPLPLWNYICIRQLECVTQPPQPYDPCRLVRQVNEFGS
jgi:hypothetical protein